MSEQYLWDQSGAPDAEIVRLEELLATYRETKRGQRRSRPGWAAFAGLGALAAALAVFLLIPKQSGWSITTDSEHSQQIPLGHTVRATQQSLTLRDSAVGEIALLPGSKLKVGRRLSLEQGTMHAFIWAPPAQFTVDTPSARAVDLGCEYTLTVQPDGTGIVRVRMGWVAFQKGAVESFVPAGAACRTGPADGPGVPYFEDAEPSFLEALQNGDVDRVLSRARPRDAITLWHLMQRTPPPVRMRVAGRFAELVPGADPSALARGDRAAIDAAWNQLGLGNTDWWRTWKRSW